MMFFDEFVFLPIDIKRTQKYEVAEKYDILQGYAVELS